MSLRCFARLVVVGGLVAGIAAAGDLAEIRSSGKLRALVVDGSPAFYALKIATAPGLDREILDGFGRLHKLTLETIASLESLKAERIGTRQGLEHGRGAGRRRCALRRRDPLGRRT